MRWKTLPSTLTEFARMVVEKHGLGGMLPVVEKELLHYDILLALDTAGWLNRLVFQGGTCLRLCYGNVRYSEDLDFTTRENLDEVDLKGFSRTLKSAIEAKYRVGLRVKEPASVKEFEGGGTLKRWQVVVDTAPERHDLPSQRIKIEIVSIPSYTSVPRLLEVNYPELPSSFGSVLVRCQEAGEILADKLVSFANSPSAPRYRDLWDIPWIAGTLGWDVESVASMVGHKHSDYQCRQPLAELLEEGRARVEELAVSPEYLQQMRRFIPLETFESTLGRKGYAQARALQTAEIYRRVEGALT